MSPQNMRFFRPNRLLAAGFALLASLPLNTQAAGLVLTGELAFGGDDLVIVSGGEDLQAGELLNLGIGFDFDLNPAKTLLLRKASITSSTGSRPTTAMPTSTAGRWT